MNILNFNLENFFQSCHASSVEAYENLKSLLAWLEDSETCSQARIILAHIEKALHDNHSHEDHFKKFHFSIDRLTIHAKENEEHQLKLLQLPSIFTPEEWSFTFFEGLMRTADDEFYHRSLAELGCGNGWISIAIAQKSSPYMIYGLDINPRAIVCAKINLYLNALNDSGILQTDSEGKSLLDKVQFHTSDLLGYCLENKIYLDKVIGCIPQVLAPNENIISSIIPENSSDESLYALSNYCAKQGYIEDQFGLGLIARAVEESIQLLKSNGKVIFNLGGRPGQAVLNRLFTRRGFITRNIWQTKIEQADDTDILPLVEIEENTSHRFEFFINYHSKDSISAKTAYLYQKSGGKIFHSLNVVEADLKDAVKMKNILNLLKEPEFQNARGALDLTYDNPNLVSEKVSFLSRFSEKLRSLKSFPYEGLKGTTSLRRRIAEFMRTYWKSPLSSKNILIAPNRQEFIKNILNIFEVKIALIDYEISRNLVLHSKSIIEIPRQSHIICEITKKLKPQFLYCSLYESEVQNQDSFRRLIDVTKENQCILLLDISEFFNLSSSQKSNGIIEYLSENKLPNHVMLLCGLIYNKIYEDMDIAFSMSENLLHIEYLSHAAELTYSRTSIVTQEYYDTVLFNLLNFHIKNEGRQKVNITRPLHDERSKTQKTFQKFSKHALDSFADSALESANLKLTTTSIRLDYGENELDAPILLKSLLMESLARQNLSHHEICVEEDIAQFLKIKYRCNFHRNAIAIGNGVAPLFSTIAQYASIHNIKILFPTGTYGYFIACAKFWGSQIEILNTTEENCFKYLPLQLKNTFQSNPNQKYFVFFNAPTVNPTGQIYTTIEFNDILDICQQFNAFTIIDTIFSGLEYSDYTDEYNLKNTKNLALLGGLSKEFASGGLRFGFAHIENKEIFDFVHKSNSKSVSKNLRYTAKRLYESLLSKDSSILDYTQQQKNILHTRASMLTKILNENGWQVMPSFGGLFLVAKPTKILGRRVQLLNGAFSDEITIDNIHRILFEFCGVLINSAKWTGIPNYCRFVLSTDETTFQEGCVRLKDFFSASKE